MINLIVLAVDREDRRQHVAMLDRDLDVTLVDVIDDDDLWKLRVDRADADLELLWSSVHGRRNRVHVTARARPTTKQISALMVLHRRFGLEDPTGLLGLMTATYHAHEGDAGRVFNVGGKAGILINTRVRQPAKAKR